MKTNLSPILGVLAILAVPLPTTIHAQEAAVETEAGERAIPLLSAEQLDELLGPVALYPDALIALMLPAATMPTDLVLAARYLAAGGKSELADQQPWDESVRSLARYPDVVKWMDENLSWALMVGDAFVAQPVDVMQSIQRLRARARAAGSLVDSPEQRVVVEDEHIRIVPARPEVIYVPVYDPQVVYVPRPYGWYGPVISYRWYYPTGSWLFYDCDWYSWRVWVVHTHHRHRWYHDRVWYRPRPVPRHHYHDGGFGRAWMPRHDHRRPEWRRDGRDRPTQVIVRDGDRDGRRGPPVVVTRPRSDDRRDGDRRGGDRRDDFRGDNRGGERPHAGPGPRPEFGRRDRDSDNRRGSDGREGRRDEPRVVRPAPSTPPPASRPRSQPEVARPSAPAQDGASKRWIGRAQEGSRAPTSRAESRTDSNPTSRATPTVRSSQPPSRAVPTVRQAPPASRRSEPSVRPSTTQTVRVPVAGGGSRSVTVSAPSRASSPPPASVAPSRSSRGGGDGGRVQRGGDRGGERGDRGSRAERRSDRG